MIPKTGNCWPELELKIWYRQKATDPPWVFRNFMEAAGAPRVSEMDHCGFYNGLAWVWQVEANFMGNFDRKVIWGAIWLLITCLSSLVCRTLTIRI